MTQSSRAAWFLCLLASCQAGPLEQAPLCPVEPLKLVAQRVSGTAKRETHWLVHVQTDREAVSTTPEHPFATPNSGWVPAGRLAPGDSVLSAKFGAVRVRSVRSQQLAQPPAVFNLTVDPSQAYLVGVAQVLVHNTRCKEASDSGLELEAAQRELETLSEALPTSLEERADLQRRIADARARITRLRARVRKIRYRQAKKARGASIAASASRADANRADAKEDAFSRNTRLLEAVQRDIQALSQASPAQRGADTAQRLAALRRKRNGLQSNLRQIHARERKRQGLPAETPRQRLLKRTEVQERSMRQELESLQRTLSALPQQQSASGAEQKTLDKQQSELVKRLRKLRGDYEFVKRLLDWERQFAALSEQLPSTIAEREALKQGMRALQKRISAERELMRRRAFSRKLLTNPTARAKRVEALREGRLRRLRAAPHPAEAERSKDMLELLTEELEALRQQAVSEQRNERIDCVREQIETQRRLVQVQQRIEGACRRRRRASQELLAESGDTGEDRQRHAQAEQEYNELRVERARLNARSILLSKVYGANDGQVLEVDEPRVREIEREVASGAMDNERLAEIEDELGNSELIDAEFLEQIWREVDAEEAAMRELAREEEDTLEAALNELVATVAWSDSPEAAFASGLQSLQQELREERNALQSADLTYADDYALVSQTLGQPGSSHHANGAQRLAELQAARVDLRNEWRQRLQRRLEHARERLRVTQSTQGVRDESVEADLGQQIALLEHELRDSAW